MAMAITDRAADAMTQPDDLARVIHEAFHVATSGRPGPVLVDIPKDVQFADGTYTKAAPALSHYQPDVKGDLDGITELVAAMETAKKPLFYTGGGVINSGPVASQLLRELVAATGFPITSTLMGLGAYPASGDKWIGMLGMHGLYEANMAMHDCDLMINIGARFDDRITGILDAFSPGSIKAHIDIDPSSINKVIQTDIPIVGDVAHVLEDILKVWKSRGRKTAAAPVAKWWDEIKTWKKINRDESWLVGDTLNSGIGQGFVLASPLQLSLMTARIASGKAVLPRLLRKRAGAPDFIEEAPKLDISQASLDMVRGGMFAVSNEIAAPPIAAGSWLKACRWRERPGQVRCARLPPQNVPRG